MGTMTESAKALLPELIKIRRDFHEYPELSGKEEETAKKVAAYLKEMGCDQVIEHVGGHGVIGVIKGASEAVSYTHLYVYKRQSMSSSNRLDTERMAKS